MIRLIIIVLATAAGLTFGVPIASAASYNQDTLAQFRATVNDVSNRYGTGPVRITIAELGDNEAIAEARYGEITLDASWAMMSPSEFYANTADDFATGYQPAGCGGIQSVAIHEMGHVIDGSRGMVARRAVALAAANGRLGSDLHGYAYEYGSVKPGEAVAVSFQAVECGSATATEQAIYNVLVN